MPTMQIKLIVCLLVFSADPPSQDFQCLLKGLLNKKMEKRSGL